MQKSIAEKEVMETSKITYQSGGYKTTIPKKIVESLDLDKGDIVVWVLDNGKLASVSPLRDVVDKNKLRNNKSDSKF